MAIQQLMLAKMYDVTQKGMKKVPKNCQLQPSGMGIAVSHATPQGRAFPQKTGEGFPAKDKTDNSR